MSQVQTPKKKKQKPEDPNELDDKTTEDPDDEDDDDKDAAEAENRRLNAIVTSRVKREMKGINTTLQAMQEQLTKLTTPKEEGVDEEDENEDGTPRTVTPKEDPKLARKMSKLEKELAEEKQARKQAEANAIQEQEKAKRNDMRGVYSAALTDLGVTDPKLLRAALNVLEEDGVMIRDEDGKIKFKGQDKYGIETNFDPKIGLKAWVATEGKSFVPAIDAGGSGTGGSRGTGNQSTSISAKEFSRMDPKQKASINLERACSGLPPLGEEV